MYNIKDIVVALATIPGKSALNVIRVSGPDLTALYHQLTLNKKKPKPNYARPCFVYNVQKKEKIDYSVITYFKGPKSFTGDDILEISTHGGYVIVNELIQTIINTGARQAQPGEFSYRAFINDKIDLIQAEAIAAIVESNNSLDSLYQLSSIKGRLSQKMNLCHGELINLITHIEHELDFVEEEISKIKQSKIQEILNSILKNMQTVSNDSLMLERDIGALKVVITGRPNVGKSSLYNQMVGKTKSIVTNIKGTTRDAIETDLFLGNILITLIDTAGIRNTKNKVEGIGIKNTYEQIKKADVVLLVEDNKTNNSYQEINKHINIKNVIIVRNKSDLINTKIQKNEFVVSCANSKGINKLTTHLSTVCNKKIQQKYSQNKYMINQRQKNALIEIQAGIEGSIKAFDESEDVTICLSYLYTVKDLFGYLLKPVDNENILNSIFKGFCVGK